MAKKKKKRTLVIDGDALLKKLEKLEKRRGKTYRLDEMTIRDVILDRLLDLGVSKYDLAHRAGCDAVPSTIFRFLSGERNTFSGNVEQILEACGIELVARSSKPHWAETVEA